MSKKLTPSEEIRELLNKVEEIKKARNEEALDEYKYIIGKCFRIDYKIFLVKKLVKYDFLSNCISFICDEIYYSDGYYNFSTNENIVNISFETNSETSLSIKNIKEREVSIDDYNSLLEASINIFNKKKIDSK